jgi:hypothetical protein
LENRFYQDNKGVGIRILEDFSAVERFAQVDDITSFDPEAARVYDTLSPVFEEAYRGLKEANESLSRWGASYSSTPIPQGEAP